MSSPYPRLEDLTIVIPAKNEADSLSRILSKIKQVTGGVSCIVVDDGSTDATAEIATTNGARVISNPYSIGNGGSIKTGVRAADTNWVLCMDADGQHRPEDIPRFLKAADSRFDMIVGARSSASQATPWRRFANGFYNRFASWMTGHQIRDLTSGFRLARRERFLEFMHLLPNGFSYPTTLTMAFFRAGYPVDYVFINAEKREGRSHISPLRDGIRFLLIIFKVGTLYSPLKLFFPMSIFLFLTGLGYYLFTYLAEGRFTNMGALLFLSSIIVFLMGLISEQITTLIYQQSGRR